MPIGRQMPNHDSQHAAVCGAEYTLVHREHRCQRSVWLCQLRHFAASPPVESYSEHCRTSVGVKFERPPETRMAVCNLRLCHVVAGKEAGRFRNAAIVLNFL